MLYQRHTDRSAAGGADWPCREGVYLDRTAQGLKPRFVKVEPHSDADMTAVLRKISRRVIGKLRQMGYLEAGSDAAMATG